MGTKFAEDVRGVRTDSKKNLKPEYVVPTTPARLHMTYAQAVEHKRKLKAAGEAAAKASRAIMEDAMPDAEEREVIKAVDKAESLAKKEELVVKLEGKKEALADLEGELEEDPKKRGVKMRITNMNKAIDVLEKQIESFE